MKRKVLQSVVVYRDGARVRPPVNSIFDFTDEEVKAINEINPNAIGKLDEAEAAAIVAKAEAEAEAAAKAEAEAAAKAEAEAAAKAEAEAKAKAEAEAAAAAKKSGKATKAEEDDL
jgi:flagellar biosynthesis/type III secretory pathway protein FliH